MLVGSHQLHTGFVLSLHTAVKFVSCVIVTVVGFAVKLAGVFPLFFIHPLNAYPLAVLHVALIDTQDQYLIPFHHPLTLATPVHAFNVNVYFSLVNQV